MVKVPEQGAGLLRHIPLLGAKCSRAQQPEQRSCSNIRRYIHSGISTGLRVDVNTAQQAAAEAVWGLQQAQIVARGSAGVLPEPADAAAQPQLQHAPPLQHLWLPQPPAALPPV